MFPVSTEGQANTAPSRDEEDRAPREALPRGNGRCHNRWGPLVAGAPTAPPEEDAQQEGDGPETEEHREENVVPVTGMLSVPDHHSTGHAPPCGANLCLAP